MSDSSSERVWGRGQGETVLGLFTRDEGLGGTRRNSSALHISGQGLTDSRTPVCGGECSDQM